MAERERFRLSVISPCYNTANTKGPTCALFTEASGDDRLLELKALAVHPAAQFAAVRGEENLFTKGNGDGGNLGGTSQRKPLTDT